MTSTILDQLIKRGESDFVDFKEIGYFADVENTSKKDKDIEFIKDLISFTNTIREENAYIIIGVTDDGRKIGIGDNDFTDGAILQSKIKDKISPIPKFSTYPFIDETGLKFQIIEIPVEKYSSPPQPTIAGNSLERNAIYIRRNTSNEKATYDEILRINEWLKSIPAKASANSKATTIAKNQKSEFQFDEITIQKLFGNEAAEDENAERLKEYYFKNETFKKVAVDLPLRILVGHKGIGKSALFNVAMSEDKECGKLPIKIKPTDVSQIGKDLSDFSDIIRNWREGLFKIISKKAFSYFEIKSNIDRSFNDFEDNFVDLLIEDLYEAKINGFVPEKNLISLEAFLSNPSINIYIDDLDRGWEGTKADITKISALLNAVRDIINDDNKRLHFKISLRSDVYFLYRTSDESTDKTQSSVIWYKWSYHEILALLVKRVRTYFKKPVDEAFLKSSHQAHLAKDLDSIIEPIFSGQGKWESHDTYRVLLSVIRKRPRDLVKLLTLAARNAENRKSPIIATQDLKAIFDEYSLDRIQDTINEYKSELPAIERLLFGMKPDRITVKTSDSFYYTTPGLLLKINRIRERGEFKFSNGKPADAKQLAAFLYKINFITATKVKEDGYIERKDFEENRYLVPKFEDFGYDWEVHMAFRWGLQPTDQDKIYNILL